MEARDHPAVTFFFLVQQTISPPMDCIHGSHFGGPRLPFAGHGGVGANLKTIAKYLFFLLLINGRFGQSLTTSSKLSLKASSRISWTRLSLFSSPSDSYSPSAKNRLPGSRAPVGRS